MARTEALKKAQDKYSQKIKQVILKFNTETEPDLLEHLQKQERVQTYIKNLIKEDKERRTKMTAYKYKVEHSRYDHKATYKYFYSAEEVLKEIQNTPYDEETDYWAVYDNIGRELISKEFDTIKVMDGYELPKALQKLA